MFSYDADVVDRFPTIRAGVGHATGVDNQTPRPGLEAEFVAEQKATLSRIGCTPLSELVPITAWRRVFAGFGVKPTQYRNAAESLLRRLAKLGDIPSINPLVDIANLVSIRYALPVACFDLGGIQGSTTVTLASGDETFTDLGSDSPVSPEPGEVVFVDEAGVVSARRWCWRQSAQSATSSATTDVLIIVEGHHEGAEDDVRDAISDIGGLVSRHGLGAIAPWAILSPTSPVYPVE